MRIRAWQLPMYMMVVAALATGCAPQGEESTEEMGPVEKTAEDLAIGIGEAPPLRAEAVLLDAEGASVGRALLTQDQLSNDVHIEAVVSGVEPPGPHGIHIHEEGDCVPPDFTSASGHFAPAGFPHDCPPEVQRHSGDLGNIVIGEDGGGTLELTVNNLTLAGGELSVVGRAVILHEDEDDCTTQPTGDAGARLACGRIVMLGEIEGDPGEMEGQTGTGTGTGY